MSEERSISMALPIRSSFLNLHPLTLPPATAVLLCAATFMNKVVSLVRECCEGVPTSKAGCAASPDHCNTLVRVQWGRYWAPRVRGDVCAHTLDRRRAIVASDDAPPPRCTLSPRSLLLSSPPTHSAAVRPLAAPLDRSPPSSLAPFGRPCSFPAVRPSSAALFPSPPRPRRRLHR